MSVWYRLYLLVTAFTLCSLVNVNNANAQTQLLNVPYSDVLALPYSEPVQRMSYGANSHQRIAYWPSRSNVNKRTPIILIHGGCWLSAFDMRHAYAQATALADTGFPVYGIEYRRTGKSGGGWPVTFEDIQLGISTVIMQLPSDIESVHIVGHSAGGHLALLAASSLADWVYRDINITVHGLAPIVDIAQYAMGENSCQRATLDFMSGLPNDKAASYYLANPMHRRLISQRVERVVLWHGSADSIVPATQAQHPDATTISVAGAGHFDWIHPQSVAFKQWLNWLSNAL